MKKRKTLLILFVLLAMLGVVYAVVSCHKNPVRRVLVMHSYQEHFPGYAEYKRLIERRFARYHDRVEIDYFYLDCEHWDAASEIKVISDYLNGLNLPDRPEVIIVNNDQATYSLLASQHPLAHTIPIVFGGVLFPNQTLLEQYSNVTGVKHTIDVVTNMKVAKELAGTRHCFTILDETAIDQMARRDCNQQLDSRPYVLNNLMWKYSLNEVYKSPDSLMTFTSFSIRDMRKNTTDPIRSETAQNNGPMNLFHLLRGYVQMSYMQVKCDVVARNMLNFSHLTQVTAINSYFGGESGNLLGGYFASIATIVDEEVSLAMRILDGDRAGDIPVMESRKDYYVDWYKMRKEGWKLDRIPEKYHVVNATFQDYHPTLWKSIVILSFALSVGLLLLLLYRLRHTQWQRRDLFDKLVRERHVMQLALSNSHAFVWRRVNDRLDLEEIFWRTIGKPQRTITIEEFAAYLHPDYREPYREKVRHANSRGEASIDVYADITGSGNYQWWQIRSKVNEEDRTKQEFFGLFINVDVVKQREQELITARKMAEQAALKESFLANMSHEIRTPLNAIVGFSNILATPGMEFSDEERMEFMETINRNNALLLKLVNDILDISRIESGYMQFEFIECSIDRLMDNVYQTYSVQVPPYLKLVYEKGEQGLYLYVDENRIQQILINFLTNAGKFTHAGSITLGWNYNRQTHEAELYVQDTGIGISEEEQLLIFERFYKSDQFKQGTGLGLSICKVIAEKLHGRITVKSKPEEGSRFSLWLKTIEVHG